jgi:hypothetical protein
MAMANPITIDIGTSNTWTFGSGWGTNTTHLGKSSTINSNAQYAGQVLSSGQSFQFLFGTITLNENDSSGGASIGPDELDNLGVTGFVDLDAPPLGLQGVTGTSVAILGALHDAQAGYWVYKNGNCIDEDWLGNCKEYEQIKDYYVDPVPEATDVTISFLSKLLSYGGGVITISFNDVTFNDVTFADNETKEVYATVSYAELPANVPEPTSLLLLGSGIMCLGFAAWRRRK